MLLLMTILSGHTQAHTHNEDRMLIQRECAGLDTFLKQKYFSIKEQRKQGIEWVVRLKSARMMVKFWNGKPRLGVEKCCETGVNVFAKYRIIKRSIIMTRSKKGSKADEGSKSQVIKMYKCARGINRLKITA